MWYWSWLYKADYCSVLVPYHIVADVSVVQDPAKRTGSQQLSKHMSCHDVQNSEAHRQRSNHRTTFGSMLNIRDKCKQSYVHDNENHLHPSVSQAHDENPPVLDGRNKHPGQERCYQINVPFMFVCNSLYAWHRRLIRVFDGSIHLQGVGARHWDENYEETLSKLSKFRIGNWQPSTARMEASVVISI